MRSTHCRRSAMLLGLFVLSCALIGGVRPGSARGQALTFLTPQKAVGTALYYRWGYIEVAAPKGSADPKTKGLIDVLPDRIPLQGPTLGVSFGDFGVVAAYNTFEAVINKKADLDGDRIGDVDVLAVQGHSVSMSLLYEPIRHFFIGYGAYRGTIAFQIVNAGVGSTQKSATRGDFYTLGLTWGIDPTLKRAQFFSVIYAALPAARSGETPVTSYGIGLGVFF